MKIPNIMIEDQEVLLEVDQWKAEASAVIQDIKEHVKNIEISNTIQNSNQFIYLNLTTIEDIQYCIELSANGFRIVGKKYDDKTEPLDRYYETPYSLLDQVSSSYRTSFCNSLLKKLEQVEAQDNDSENSV